MFKKGFHGTFRKMSPARLRRYVAEFADRRNIRPMDAIDRMIALSDGMDGKRLKYDDLIA